MSTFLKTTAVVRVNESTREFFKAMQFPHEIPEDCKYIAFLEDGDATFLSEEEAPVLTLFSPNRKFVMLTYDTTPIEIAFE